MIREVISDGFCYGEYLSKGQFTELEKCIRNNKKVLFFDAIYGGNLQKQHVYCKQLKLNFFLIFLLR